MLASRSDAFSCLLQHNSSHKVLVIQNLVKLSAAAMSLFLSLVTFLIGLQQQVIGAECSKNGLTIQLQN